MTSVKKPDKVHLINRIEDLEYRVRFHLEGTLSTIELSLTEFKYLHDAYEKFSKQSGFKGFDTSGEV